MPQSCTLDNYTINCPGCGCVIVKNITTDPPTYTGTCIDSKIEINDFSSCADKLRELGYTLETKFSILINNVTRKHAAEFLDLFFPGTIQIPSAGGMPISTKEFDIPISQLIESIGLKIK
jgi:hypothetical protein